MTDTTETPKPPIDMNIPETFHRLKRTVMLLSTALLALGIAHGAADQTLKITFTDVKLPADVVRWLLVGASAYYLWGFYMEVRMVHLLNSEAMFGKAMKSVNEMFGQLHSGLLDWHRRLSSPAERAEQECAKLALLEPTHVDPSLLARIVQARSEALDGTTAGKTLQHAAPMLREAVIAEIATQTATIQEANTILKAMQTEVNNFSGWGQDLLGRLDSIHKAMTRLSSRISGVRKASFYAWEIGGAVSIFVVAILFNINELYRGATQLWGYLFPA